MSTKIQLTPAELQAQATEMISLKDEFDSLFTGVTSELRTINSNWSPNLANNFVGKISSAQKSFSQVVDMLDNGAKVANNCAVSFASVDSELSKIFDGASKAGKAFWNAFVDNIKNVPEDIKTSAELLEWLEKYYGELPDDIKKFIKDACPDNLEEAYKLTSDLLQGDLSMENVYSLLEYVTDNSTECKVIIGTFKWFFDNLDEINRMDAELQKALTKEILEGDLLGVVAKLSEGFIDQIGGGVIEVGGNLIGDVVDGYIKKSYSFLGDIPIIGDDIKDLVDDSIKELLGDKTFGEYISKGSAYLADGVDTITDGLFYGINYISDTAINDAKDMISWFSRLF